MLSLRIQYVIYYNRTCRKVSPSPHSARQCSLQSCQGHGPAGDYQVISLSSAGEGKVHGILRTSDKSSISGAQNLHSTGCPQTCSWDCSSSCTTEVTASPLIHSASPVTQGCQATHLANCARCRICTQGFLHFRIRMHPHPGLKVFCQTLLFVDGLVPYLGEMGPLGEVGVSECSLAYSSSAAD